MGTNVLLPVNAVTIYRGSSATYKLTAVDADGKPLDLTGASVHFTVKRSLEDTLPVIRKSTANVAEAEITSPKGGIAKIYLVPADTKNLHECQYVFDVWTILASGKRYPIVPPSIFEVLPAVSILP